MIRGNRAKGNLVVTDAKTYGKQELDERSAWWCEQLEKETIKAFSNINPDIFD
jgi:hypothetical protein